MGIDFKEWHQWKPVNFTITLISHVALKDTLETRHYFISNDNLLFYIQKLNIDHL